ncbi:MAG: hydrogenase maturation protease [Cyanobacteriota bacterium]|nr:hydrogenase maturation protease [Cyanobacteriota bacterium]
MLETTRDRSKATKIAILGYGNDLRGDDGAGPQVARMFADRALPGVQSLALHQLTPDLAQILSEVELAIFVDAYPVELNSSISPDVQWHRLVPQSSTLTSNHSSNPAQLLELARFLYDSYPTAWLVAIPATNFEFGEVFSPVTRRGVDRAVGAIARLLKCELENEAFNPSQSPNL